MKQPKPCAGCIYWRPLSKAGWTRCACHFLLDTGRRRRKGKSGRCLERENRGE